MQASAVLEGRRPPWSIAALITLRLLSACQERGTGSGPSPPSDSAVLVGAHYYLWFPARFERGMYLRGKLRPAQPPLLGEYSSASPAVAEQHIAWASKFGIDFFTLDWWPSAPDGNANIDRAFLAARNLGEIRFCIFYEPGGPRIATADPSRCSRRPPSSASWPTWRRSPGAISGIRGICGWGAGR